MLGISIEQQFSVFLNFCLIGMIIGFVFELFRAFGKVFQFRRRAFFFVDLFLCLLATFYICFALFLWNYGEVRFYIFLALILGMILYYLIISRYIYKYLILTFKFVRSMQDFINEKRIICIRLCYGLKKYFLKEKENQNEKE